MDSWVCAGRNPDCPLLCVTLGDLVSVVKIEEKKATMAHECVSMAVA